MNTAVAQAPGTARAGRRSQVENFFRTLILGDFEDQPNTPAEIIGGLLSMIPVLDQVLDVRDIAANLYRINAQGGFSKATPDQVVNLGFAAFGAIPTVGSAFKTVFKPLWRERHLAKGAVNGGTQAIEALLGMRKGGAIRWIREELLAKWPARANEAIAQVNLAMASCIALLEFVSTAGGWQGWLIPDSIQKLAGEALPGLRAMQSAIDSTLHRASEEIRLFLTDLLGEQAADVLTAALRTAAADSAHTGSRSKQMAGRHAHNAADPKTQGKDIARQSKVRTQGQNRTDDAKGAGAVHNALQVTRKMLENMAARAKGLVGEHIVDYHELTRLGGSWPHDTSEKDKWAPATVRKLNVDQRPVNLSLSDLPKVTLPGLDAVWQKDGQYTVTEAKASLSLGNVYGLGKSKEKRGSIPVITGVSEDLKVLHYLLTDSLDKGGTETTLMQMSEEWVKDRARREGLDSTAKAALISNRAVRRVVLVTFESQGALDHAQAWLEVNSGVPPKETHPHTDHGITREWEAAEIDAVAKARERAHETKQAAQPTQPPPSGSKSKKKKS
jgi:hypothetical protein